MDKALSASEGNEASLILCGLREGCRKGMIFAQLPSGTLVTPISKIRIQLPKLKCDKPTCALFQVFNPDGSQGISGGIPKKGYVDLQLSDLLGTGIVSPSHDGEWLIKVRMFFKDNDGNEASALGWAFVRINILANNYRRLGCDEPDVAWSVLLNKKPYSEAQYTTGFRTAICD